VPYDSLIHCSNAPHRMLGCMGVTVNNRMRLCFPRHRALALFGPAVYHQPMRRTPEPVCYNFGSPVALSRQPVIPSSGESRAIQVY
jgi:hypothetical protein